MSKVVKAQYDEQTQTFRLLEPVEGVADHEEVSLVVKPKRPWSDLEGILKGQNGEDFARAIEETKPVRPWSKFEGILEGEDGERFARAIEEAFPIEPIKK